MKQEPIRVLICDEDELNLGINQRCVEIISRREHIEVQIFAFQKYTEEMEVLITSNQVEIAILDTTIGEMDGMELARKLQEINPRIPIIFVTSLEEYKSQACDLMALGYIRKPLELDKFELLYHRAIVLVDSEKQRKVLQLIELVENKKHIQLRLSSIYSVEKVLRKVEIHTVKGDYIVNATLSEINKKLGSGFMKVSQSVIVNRNKILSVDRSNIYLVNGEKHVIGRTYMKQVRQVCKNCLEEKEVGFD